MKRLDCRWKLGNLGLRFCNWTREGVVLRKWNRGAVCSSKPDVAITVSHHSSQIIRMQKQQLDAKSPACVGDRWGNASGMKRTVVDLRG
jgi:hypothetical protein